MSLEYREGRAGGCLINGEETCVALPRGDCDEGTFIAANSLRTNRTLFQKSCNSRLDDVVIGRCGDSGKCSNLKERCRDPSTFVAFDSNCTIIMDMSTDEPTPVTYGKCAQKYGSTKPLSEWQSGDRCVWSSSDCGDREMYSRDVGECTADMVQIGACFAEHTSCATSQKSCVDQYINEPFLHHIEMKEKFNVYCFLAGTSPTPNPTKAPTPSKAPTPNDQVYEPQPETSSESDRPSIAPTAPQLKVKSELTSDNPTKSGISQGALIGIVVGSATVIGVALGLYMSLQQKKARKAHAERRKAAKKAPVSNIGIQEIAVDSDEDLSVGEA